MPMPITGKSLPRLTPIGMRLFVAASGALKPMPEAKIAQAVELLDLMLEHFADEGH